MKKVLISACLLGEKVRYDGGDKRCEDAILTRWHAEGRLVPICPELTGGLGVPRPPAEIPGGQGTEVLDGRARVMAKTGEDVTDAFIRGAEAALALAKREGAVCAVLMARSPSCGSRVTYDGSFSGHTVAGQGVTAALLIRNGIAVFPPDRVSDAAAYVDEG